MSRSAADISNDLRHWMREQGLSQSDVAARLGVRQPQISRILAGQFGRRSDTVRRWARLAGVALAPPGRALVDATQREVLVGLLDEIWDGSADDAERVAALLRAAADLRNSP